MMQRILTKCILSCRRGTKSLSMDSLGRASQSRSHITEPAYANSPWAVSAVATCANWQLSRPGAAMGEHTTRAARFTGAPLRARHNK